jgi:hypothetical protein
MILVLKELPNYLKHSNQIQLSLYLTSVTYMSLYLFSVSIGKIILASLTNLDLDGNRLEPSFHSHTMQRMVLVMKVRSNYEALKANSSVTCCSLYGT